MIRINNKGTRLNDNYYEKAYSFSDGLARVRINGKLGYIDTLGNLVIEPKFIDAKDFHAGLAKARIGAR